MKVNYSENFASRKKVYVLRRDLKRNTYWNLVHYYYNITHHNNGNFFIRYPLQESDLKLEGEVILNLPKHNLI